MGIREQTERKGHLGPPFRASGAGRRARRSLPGMAGLFSLLFLVVGWMLGFARLNDNSFLVHLSTGHWILDHWVPREDIYSYTAHGDPWVAHSWLAEAVYALLDRSAGPRGIQLLGAATGALIALLAYRLAYRVQGERGASAILAVAALAPAAWLWTERPLFPGVLAMLALIWIAEVPDSRAGRESLLFLPPLMCVWANVHGSFMLGFAYVLVHLAGRWLDGSPPWRGRELRLAQGAALGFAACFVNPYGPALVLFPFGLLGREHILVRLVEWASPEFDTPVGIVFALWIVVVMAALVFARNPPSRRDMLLLTFSLVIALWAMRNIAVAPLMGLPIVARVLAGERRPDERNRMAPVLAAVAVLVVAQWTAGRLARPAYDYDGYPVAAMRAVEARGLLGHRLFTTDEWAGYVIHAYWPRQKVFLDDRYDMYPTSVIEDYLAVREQPAKWRHLADRYRIDVVVWPTGRPLARTLHEDPDWRRVHGDRQATVFTRR
ncbi:hypothetical protein [Actinomadura sp. 7K534]|uniref:hypothetical protein n=1 Tax=Actinomadura sp. 7K534 TaxID=2530366 RepID=UPI001044B453|nr:hypothetical protein [Actinomadura sp. 7K534]TDB87972.1 hypothetical protein E1266_31950 [Actinomadura sp. 7K534]